MFGDLVLRLPDIVHSLYDRKKDWQIAMTWAVWFANESGIFTGANEKLLNLVSLEFKKKQYKLSCVPRKPIFRVSDIIQQKPVCTATGYGFRHEFMDLGSREFVLSI